MISSALSPPPLLSFNYSEDSWQSQLMVEMYIHVHSCLRWVAPGNIYLTCLSGSLTTDPHLPTRLSIPPSKPWCSEKPRPVPAIRMMQGWCSKNGEMGSKRREFRFCCTSHSVLRTPATLSLDRLIWEMERKGLTDSTVVRPHACKCK